MMIFIILLISFWIVSVLSQTGEKDEYRQENVPTSANLSLKPLNVADILS